MLDVRQAEELVYQASQTIPDTERAIEQTENQISLLLGNNPGAIARGKPLAQQEELPAVPAGLPSSLLERRPDIRAAEENLVAQRALVSAAKAAYFPRISLTGLLGFQSNQLSSLFTGPSRAWTFVPQITQPIFTGGRLKSNVKFARAQQELALDRVSADDSERFPGSFGCADPVSQSKRDSCSAGIAGDDTARPIATGISEIRRRR